MSQGCEKYLRGELERGQVACITWSNAFLLSLVGGNPTEYQVFVMRKRFPKVLESLYSKVLANKQDL